jgi:exosortase/archaeosortase family protein
MGGKPPGLMYFLAYVVVFAAVVWLFYTVPSRLVEELTARLSAGLLNVFGLSASWAATEGSPTLALDGQRAVAVSIIRECTALNVVGVMVGLILPLTDSWAARLKGIALSAAILFSLNIPRIALTVYLSAFDTWPFSLLPYRGLETYHYPISLAFGVVGVAVAVLAVSVWTTPGLADTLVGFIERTRSLVWAALRRLAGHQGEAVAQK